MDLLSLKDYIPFFFISSHMCWISGSEAYEGVHFKRFSMTISQRILNHQFAVSALLYANISEPLHIKVDHVPSSYKHSQGLVGWLVGWLVGTYVGR
jgi:hypothetical protein